MIVKTKGGEYTVTDHTGNKVLGKHKTKKDALAQLRAIEASKARRAAGGK